MKLRQTAFTWQEGAFFAFLILFSAFIRLYGLGLVPPGPAFVESVMGLDLPKLATVPYTPHLAQPQAAFPSLIHYQGLAFTRWLGWGVGALRVPAALWGVLAVAAFYFLLRQFTAVFTAAVFSLLFSVSALNLTLSRLFFPGSLLFFSATATPALLLAGLRRGGRAWFLAAGLACGLALHGYVPGRLLPLAFGAWLGWLWWRGRRGQGEALGLDRLLAFGLGALLAALPVLWWAWQQPEAYWGAVQHHSLGLFGTVTTVLKSLPDYLRMFYDKPDAILEPTDGLARFPVLRPDLMTQLLLPWGLYLCARHLGKPMSALVLGGFILGLLPAATAGNYPAPCTRRALLVLPWAYAAAAMGWEHLLASVPAGWLLRLRALAVGLCLLACAWSLQEYFVGIMQSPGMKLAFNAGATRMGEEMRDHAQSEVRVSYDLAIPGTADLVFRRDSDQRRPLNFQDFLLLGWRRPAGTVALKQAEDFLVFEKPGPRLLLMAPYLEAAQPWLQALFPKSEIKAYRLKVDPRSPTPPWDPFAPGTQLLRLALDSAEVKAFSGLVDLSAPPAGPAALRRACFDPAFGEAQRGRSLDLGGVWVLPVNGQASLKMGWPGWRLWIDGKAQAWGMSPEMRQGSHRVRLSGRAPQGALGPLPLQIQLFGVEQVSAGALLPVDPRHGLLSEAWPVGQSPTSRPWTRYEPLPVHRYSPPEGFPLPADVRLKALLRPAKAGTYELRIRPPLFGRLYADGKCIYDSSLSVPDPYPVNLSPVKPVLLQADIRVDEEYDHPRTLILDQRVSGEIEWSALPWDEVWTP